jgi:hypothetical protein
MEKVEVELMVVIGASVEVVEVASGEVVEVATAGVDVERL